MKGAFDQIVGKRIKGVVAKQSSRPPENQLFLLFSDDTYFEVYGQSMCGCNGIDRGGLETVRNYMVSPERKITLESVDERIGNKDYPNGRNIMLDKIFKIGLLILCFLFLLELHNYAKNGRYVAVGDDNISVLDTQTGVQYDHGPKGSPGSIRY